MTPPSKHDRIVIALALDVLREAMTAALAAPVGTPAVRLALRCLLPHCPERWPLTAFWDAAIQELSFGRPQAIGAAFNGICHQLRQAGRMEEG